MTILSHFKKGIAALTLSVMSMALVPVGAFAYLDFTDAAQIPAWAVEAIEELVAIDVLQGNDDGSFAPARQLNRAEVAKIVTLAAGVDMDTMGGPHFPDVQENAWYYDYVETMYNYGWIDGNPDGTFRPGNGINRAELAKMVVNALELDLDTTGAPHFDDVSSNDWFFDYVETAYNWDLMRGYADGTFGPAKPVNRAETAKIVYDGLLAISMPYGPAEGTLEVSLSNETPRGTNVPFNATSVPYTTLEFTSSDDADVEMSSLTLTRLGLGDNDDFKNVWMEIDGFKVGNDKSINNDDVVELRFNPPIVVPAGQTLVADIVASSKYTLTDKNVGHHNRLAVVSADDVASTALNVVGDFPIEGEEMAVADYQVSMLDFGTLGSDTTLDVGSNFVEIGKFRVLNETTTNKDIEFRAITFKNDGTAELENVLENVALYVGGEQVSAESIIDGDYITFRLDNGVTGGYIIEDGDSRIFSMRADIVSAEKGDTIQFKVDNFEDLVAIEIGTAFGVKATSDFYNDGAAGTSTLTNQDAEDNWARLRTYSIDSGDLNVSRDPSSLGNQQYAPGSNDVVAMTARLIVDQPLLVDGVTLTATYANTITPTLLDTLTEANAHFNNFRLFLNDSLVDSENLLVTDGTDTDGTSQLTYDTTFEIAGASILKLVMNIQNAAATGSNIKFAVAATAFASPEYISTGDQVVSTQMLGTATGSLVEVTESTLTITQTDGYTAETIVAGVDDITMFEFVLDNNDSGDVNVTSISVKGTGIDKAAQYGNYTAAIFVDGTQQGSSKNLSTATATLGEATFNDLSVIISSAGQKEFTLVVNTSEVLSDGNSAGSAAVPAVAQQDTITIGGAVNAADQFIAVINGNTFQTVGAGATPTLKATELASIINANISFSATNVAGVITVVAAVPGTPFTVGGVSTIDGDATPTETIATVNTVANVVAVPAVAVNLADDMTFAITAVDADNVENGQTVVTTNAGVAVAPATPLTGATFTLVPSGSLAVSALTSTVSDIVVAGTKDVEVLKVRLAADDDEVQIKDFYFKNGLGTTFGPRADFKLYNEAGQLMQTKQMGALDTLHFELANQSRISVPKDGSTFVTVKIDVRSITDVTMSGKQLRLDLDTTVASKGIAALTAATGSDIATPALGWGTAVGQNFIAYRTRLSIVRMLPSTTTLAPATHQELFRFKVTADAAGAAMLDQVTLNVVNNGATITAGTYIVEDAADSNTTYTYAAGAVDFNELLLQAGESKTFILYADVTAAPANSSISTQLSSDSAVDVLAPTTSAALIGANKIVWSDESSSGNTDFFNGYLIKPDNTATTVSNT